MISACLEVRLTICLRCDFFDEILIFNEKCEIAQIRKKELCELAMLSELFSLCELVVMYELHRLYELHGLYEFVELCEFCELYSRLA